MLSFPFQVSLFVWYGLSRLTVRDPLYYFNLNQQIFARFKTAYLSAFSAQKAHIFARALFYLCPPFPPGPPKKIRCWSRHCFNLPLEYVFLQTVASQCDQNSLGYVDQSGTGVQVFHVQQYKIRTSFRIFTLKCRAKQNEVYYLWYGEPTITTFEINQ